MIQPLVLEFVQHWFRSKYGWKPEHCGVQELALPSIGARSWYVAFDDGGVEAGPEETDSLKETVTITIGIWKQPEHLMADQRGTLKLPHDKYLLGAYTLGELEQKVKVERTVHNGLFGLHKNYLFMNALNEYHNLPDFNLGATFTKPFYYAGRGTMETMGYSDGSPTPQAWYGYRLRFRGLLREQLCHQPTYGIG